MTKIVAMRQVAASERAKALFQAASREAQMVALTTMSTAAEAMEQLREASELPTLAPGVADLFRRMSERLREDLDTARAILERH